MGLGLRRVFVVLLSLVFTLALAPPAFGQEDPGRAAREREALRRSQAALRQSQEQQEALAREKSELSAQRDQLGNAARRAESQLAASRSEAARTRSEVARLTAELAALRVQSEADNKESGLRVEALTQRLEEANRIAAERTRTIASLASLLERATSALTTAEKLNREMYAFGLQMIDQISGNAGTDRLAQNDPVLGFGRVQLENRAEELRDRLAALRLPSAPAAK
jgi:chromosome segregation ATPase